MPLLPPTFIGLLDTTNPRGTDSRTISDDYHRMIQTSVKQTLPNLTGEVTATHLDLNKVTGFAANNATIMTGDSGVTKAVFINATAPVGWTIDNTFDGRSLMVAGTINGVSVPGAGTGGSHDPGLDDKVASHNHGPGSLAGTAQSAGSHVHPLGYYAGNGDQPLTVGTRFATSTAGGDFTRSAGTANARTASYIQSGGAHTHSVNVESGTTDLNAAVNYQPLHVAGIVCTLN